MKSWWNSWSKFWHLWNLFFPSRNMECFSTSKLLHLFLYFSSYAINTIIVKIDAFSYMFCPLPFRFKNKLASILWHYNFTNEFYIMHVARISIFQLHHDRITVIFQTQESWLNFFRRRLPHDKTLPRYR